MVHIDKGVNLKQKMDIVYAGTCTVTKAANATQGVNTFSHSLGYKPAFLAYALIGSSGTIYYPVPYLYLGSSGSVAGLVRFKLDVVADIDSVNCYVITPNISGDTGYYDIARTVTFYLYFLKQDASES